MIVVVDSLAEDHWARAHGRVQENLQITATRGIRCDYRLHVLQIVDLSIGAIACIRVYLQE